MIKVDNISLNPTYTENDILQKVARVLKVDKSTIEEYVILKKSIDARHKPDVKIILSLAVSLKGNKTIKGFESVEPNYDGLQYDKVDNISMSPVVVGFGPAGMFCALALAKMGLKPIVVEQGMSVEDREKAVLKFWETGEINPKCNVQFGEGGAGTFSDGKLNTNLNNHYCKLVINEFVLAGAPTEIRYINKPHIGSDNLKSVVKNIRKQIISLGGQVLFNTEFVDYKTIDGKLTKVIVKNLIDDTLIEIDTNQLALCIGHSARPTFDMLYGKGLEFKQKPFAMGVRIEQKQADINMSQYGMDTKVLPSADYKLAVHLDNGRSVFTFCMCPGGVVVNSADSCGEIVTNGMSYFKRDKENANSAVLVNVTPEDYGSSHPLAGIEFQRKYERLAYGLTNSHYCPAQTVGEFLTGDKTELRVNPSLKVKMTDIFKCLPDFVVDSLKLGLPLLDKKLKNFAHPGNLLVAIESRSSSPVTIVRGDDMQSTTQCGIYPCGEGAGYAGGIISSAVDGIKVAEAIRENINKKV